MAKTYRVYEKVVVEKTIDYCEQCDFSNYTYDCSNQRLCGGSCGLYHDHLCAEGEHIPIPDWCKIEKIPFTLTGRDMR